MFTASEVKIVGTGSFYFQVLSESWSVLQARPKQWKTKFEKSPFFSVFANNL